MKKQIYNIYYSVFGFLVGINVILLILSIIFNIKNGMYGSLISTVLFVLAFNFSSISLSKTKLKYHGKPVTKEMENDIVYKIFWKRCFMYGMAIQAIIALVYIIIWWIIKGGIS